MDYFGNYRPLQRYEVIHVNGENGAQALQMLPNSNVIVMDDTAPMVWLCQTDGAGYKTCTPFDITPHKRETPADALTALMDRVKRLEEIINEQSNGKPATQAEQ